MASRGWLLMCLTLGSGCWNFSRWSDCHGCVDGNNNPVDLGDAGEDLAVAQDLSPPDLAGAGYRLNLSAIPFTGSAAIGSASDYWNAFGVGNNPDYQVQGLRWIDNSTSPVTLHVQNLAGGWYSTGEMPSNGMYHNYLYNQSGSTAQVTILSLPAGTYGLYIYGHTTGAGGNENTTFFVTVHDSETGQAKSTTTTRATLAGPDTATWQEGVQYVHYSGIVVGAGQVVRINITLGTTSTTNCLLNGVQIVAE